MSAVHEPTQFVGSVVVEITRVECGGTVAALLVEPARLKPMLGPIDP
jgi:hypothetical protein